MAFWDRWFGRKASSLDLLKLLSLGPAKSGQNVTTASAMQATVVLACARVLADGIAQVPLKLFRESDDGRSRDPAKDHPLYAVLYRKPNDWQTSFAFRETMMLHTALTGNFFAFINRVAGDIAELIPFEPSSVTVKRDDRSYERTYEVRAPDGSARTFPAESIWHVKGPSWNSWLGMDAVKLARESIGLALAAEEHHAKLHKNGAKPGGVLSVEGNLTEEQYKRLKTWIETHYEGAENAFKTMILDRGAKFASLAVNGVDLQHLETRRFQVEDVCRAFRVMPIMIGHADKVATYASAEQMFLAHVVHTLSPWYQRIEQAIDTQLLSDEDRRAGLYAKFNANGLMRGDFASRTEGYAKALGSGGSPAWMEINEVRALEEMNAVSWGDGKPQSSNQAAPQDDEDDDGHA